MADSAAHASIPTRPKWSSKCEFILTCIGFCVGLGNVWRFPYLCYSNGGGAFLIPYFTMLVFIGFPMLFMEFSFGQYIGLGPITVWKVCPLFKGVGFGYFVLNCYLCIYYTLIIALSVYYMFASLNSSLPWSACGNAWNTDQCWADVALDSANITGNQSLQYDQTVKVSSAEEYFIRRVFAMQESTGLDHLGSVRWELALCLLLTWILLLIFVSKGIKTTGKVVYFAATFPYVMLTTLVIRGFTLPGAYNGILYYLQPRWEVLLEPKVWYAAGVQIFYSLGLSYGTFLCMSSYNNFNNNILRDAVITGFANSLTSFYAGLAVFSVLGYMSNQLGVPMDRVVTSGPSLAFVVYPRALATMPGAPFWSFLFFFMLFLIGVDSVMIHVEALNTMVVDEFPAYLRKHRFYVSLGFCLAFFLMGLVLTTSGGMYVLTLMDWYSTGLALLLIGIVECIVINFIYGHKKFCKNIEEMIKKTPSLYWKICWLGATPLFITFLLVMMVLQSSTQMTYGDYVFPEWSVFLGWVIAAIPFIPIPVFIVFKLSRKRGSIKARFVWATTPEDMPSRDKTSGHMVTAAAPPSENSTEMGLLDSHANSSPAEKVANGFSPKQRLYPQVPELDA